MFGEVLRGDIPALRRREINQQLAEILRRETERTPAELLKLAVIWQGSGERVDSTSLAEAAQVANRLSDHLLAEKLALDSLKQQRSFLAQLELGWSLVRQRRLGEAAELLAPLVGSEPDDNARERLADGLSLSMGHGLGRVDEALALVAEIEGSAVNLNTRALIRCHRATLNAFVCRYEQAIELGLSATRVDEDDDGVFVRSLTSVASSLVMTGRTEDALSLTEAGLTRAVLVCEELPRALAWAFSSRCTALAFAGRVSEAFRLSPRSYPHRASPPRCDHLQICIAPGFFFLKERHPALFDLSKMPPSTLEQNRNTGHGASPCSLKQKRCSGTPLLQRRREVSHCLCGLTTV